MGTNYYAIKKKPRIVKIYDEIHLGKSSIGWKFVFQEQEQYHNFEEFKNYVDKNIMSIMSKSNEEEIVGLDYEKKYYMMMDEMSKKLEYQKEEYEKEKKKLEEELHFYKNIIKSVLNIRD